MRLFIDGNILLDVLQNREPYVTESSIIWKLCETGQMEGYISTLTFANLVYIMRRELSPEKIEEVLKKLALIFRFGELNARDLTGAAALQWNDFEDAVQSVIAKRIRADFIITRNIQDFRKSIIPALTPNDFIGQIM